MFHRFAKLNFVLLAMTLIFTPLAAKAQQAHHHEAKWTGVHVGVFGGAASGNYQLHEDLGGGTIGDINSKISGGRFGVNGGYDVNFKGLVVGGLIDWSWANAGFKFGESSGGVSAEVSSKVKQMTTVRGRVGKTYGSSLLYVHGGLLVADTEFKDTITSSTVFTSSAIHNGFVVGAGFDHNLSKRVYFNAEYAYNHVNGYNISDTIFGGSGTTATERPHFNTLTLGVNYRF